MSSSRRFLTILEGAMTINYISSPSRRKKTRFGPPPLLRPARKGEKTGTLVNFDHEHHRTHETPEREVFDSNPKHRVPETNDWQQLFSAENLSRDAFWSIDLVCVLVEGILCGRFGGVVFSWYPFWGGFQEHRLFVGSSYFDTLPKLLNSSAWIMGLYGLWVSTAQTNMKPQKHTNMEPETPRERNMPKLK